MPQARKPPRLWLRREGDKSTWIIIDGKKHVRTGYSAHEIEDAQQKLAEYIAEKFEPERDGRSYIVKIAEVLAVYLDEKSGSTSRPKETERTIARLNDYMGDKPVAEIKGKLCRDFAQHRKTDSGARRDLEVLRAALVHYHKEYGLDALPTLTLPPKSLPRDRYLTRSEAASLLWASMGWEKVGTGDNAYWKRRRDQKRGHLARLILIGIYTGTRSGAIQSLQWIRNTSGGYVDMDREVIFRRADGERVAHNKRKPPVKMAPSLAAHMRRWKKMDGWHGDKSGIRHVVHYNGGQITKLNKAFRSARAAAGLGDDVVPHVLRHTRGTWLAQAKVPAGIAAASLGLTVEEYERTYLHNDPDFQSEAANAY